jgi:CRISPR-associated protein Cas6
MRIVYARQPEPAARPATMVDLQFELRGERMPAEHGWLLYRAIAEHLPWLEEERHAGIHSVRAAAIDGTTLGLSRRVRLVLRVPRARAAEARALEGRRLSLEGTALEVGAARERAIEPWSSLHARLAIAGPEDETAFLAALGTLLAEAGHEFDVVLGRAASIATPEGRARGYAVLLHGVSAQASIELQECGIGTHRLYGCGLLVPFRTVGSVRGEP